MTNEQMLTELIELAATNGWVHFGHRQPIVDHHFINSELMYTVDYGGELVFSVNDFLFNHDFAKAVFGDELMRNTKTVSIEGQIIAALNYEEEAWLLHLQQLAIIPEADRIKYAYEHRMK